MAEPPRQDAVVQSSPALDLLLTAAAEKDFATPSDSPCPHVPPPLPPPPPPPPPPLHPSLPVFAPAHFPPGPLPPGSSLPPPPFLPPPPAPLPLPPGVLGGGISDDSSGRAPSRLERHSSSASMHYYSGGYGPLHSATMAMYGGGGGGGAAAAAAAAADGGGGDETMPPYATSSSRRSLSNSSSCSGGSESYHRTRSGSHGDVGEKRARPPSLEERMLSQDVVQGPNDIAEPHVGLLPGMSLTFAQLQQGQHKGARRARREILTNLDPAQKTQRRKERARAYSALARKRHEANMKELMCEVEKLSVFRLLIEEAADSIAVLSPEPEPIILYASPSFQDFLHIPPEALLGRPFYSIICPQDKAVVATAIDGVMQQEQERTRAKSVRLLLPASTTNEMLDCDASFRYGTQGVLVSLRP